MLLPVLINILFPKTLSEVTKEIISGDWGLFLILNRLLFLCGISYTTLMMSFLQTEPNYQSNIHVGDKDGKAEK